MTIATIIEENRNGQIGRPADRVDGHAKVTGQAQYSHEIQEAGPALYGVLVTAPIARGRVAAARLEAAKAAPGVRLVWTHAEAPQQAEFGFPHDASNRLWTAKPALYDDQVRFFGDVVAVVVAETFEQATAAAALVEIDYEETPADLDFEHVRVELSSNPGNASELGDFDAAFAAAPLQIDAAYTTPVQIHAQMEPHASLATWNGDELTVFTGAQLLKPAQRSVAETLRIDRDKVRIVSRYIGGGFGGKLHADPTAILAALTARELCAPVKIALTRQQMFSVSTHRTPTRQRVRLGAAADGTLTAIGHEAILHSARHFEFTEPAAMATRRLYAGANRRTSHSLVQLDVPMADAVRAPGEAVGLLALECAMDELAIAAGLDPIELRIRNEPAQDPEKAIPYSSRSLVECMREGARRFGWERRETTPGKVRDGRFLVGLGMAASIRSNYLMPAQCELGLSADGTATVRQAMTDIGTGTYTILGQIAAEALGLPISQVRVEIGDSSFPPAPGSGGSFGAASAGSALLDAAEKLRRQIADIAVGDMQSPLFGADPEQAFFAESSILIGNTAEPLADLLSRVAPDGLIARGRIDVPKDYNDTSQHAHGAHFAEVGVDPVTGEVRLRRMLGVFAAGRILNAKTARSQAIGGMIWGVGQALTEDNAVDTRYGSMAAQDLQHYHPPVHADIVDLDAVFIAEHDDKGNPLGIKGVGELGICGAGAALANAVFNACGVRIRDYPLSIDKMLPALISAGF